MATWERFDPVTVSVGLDQGLQAQIADPLWLLGRQWQMGEFTGDDSAQPAAARVSWRTLPIESFRPGDGRVEDFDHARPVEEMVETSWKLRPQAVGLSSGDPRVVRAALPALAVLPPRLPADTVAVLGGAGVTPFARQLQGYGYRIGLGSMVSRS